MQSYNKLIASIVTPTIYWSLQQIGITPDMPVSEAVNVIIGIALTSFMVYLVPNKKK